MEEAAKLREMSEEELQQKGLDLRQELFNLRFQRATNQIENLNKIGMIKKDLARVLTIISEKEKQNRSN